MADTQQLTAQQRWDALREVLAQRLEKNATLPPEEQYFGHVGIKAIAENLAEYKPALAAVFAPARDTASLSQALITQLRATPELSAQVKDVITFQNDAAFWDRSLTTFASFEKKRGRMEELVQAAVKNPAPTIAAAPPTPAPAPAATNAPAAGAAIASPAPATPPAPAATVTAAAAPVAAPGFSLLPQGASTNLVNGKILTRNVDGVTRYAIGMQKEDRPSVSIGGQTYKVEFFTLDSMNAAGSFRPTSIGLMDASNKLVAETAIDASRQRSLSAINGILQISPAILNGYINAYGPQLLDTVQAKAQARAAAPATAAPAATVAAPQEPDFLASLQPAPKAGISYNKAPIADDTAPLTVSLGAAPEHPLPAPSTEPNPLTHMADDLFARLEEQAIIDTVAAAAPASAAKDTPRATAPAAPAAPQEPDFLASLQPLPKAGISYGEAPIANDTAPLTVSLGAAPEHPLQALSNVFQGRLSQQAIKPGYLRSIMNTLTAQLPQQRESLALAQLKASDARLSEQAQLAILTPAVTAAMNAAAADASLAGDATRLDAISASIMRWDSDFNYSPFKPDTATMTAAAPAPSAPGTPAPATIAAVAEAPKTPAKPAPRESLSRTAEHVSEHRFTIDRKSKKALRILDGLEGKKELTREEAGQFIHALELLRSDTRDALQSDRDLLSQYNTRAKSGRIENAKVAEATAHYDRQIAALKALTFDKKNKSQALALPDGLDAAAETQSLVVRLNHAFNELNAKESDLAYLRGHHADVRDDYLRTPNRQTREQRLKKLQQAAVDRHIDNVKQSSGYAVDVPKLDEPSIKAMFAAREVEALSRMGIAAVTGNAIQAPSQTPAVNAGNAGQAAR